jgi:hypothetical protein
VTERSSLEQRPPPWSPAVNMAPLSVSTLTGKPCLPAASWKHATTSAALNTDRASEATRSREWSSSTFSCVPRLRDRFVGRNVASGGGARPGRQA